MSVSGWPDGGVVLSPFTKRLNKRRTLSWRLLFYKVHDTQNVEVKVERLGGASEHNCKRGTPYL